MAATLENNDDHTNIQSDQPILLDAQLFSLPGEEDETDLDGTGVIENPEKEPPIKPPETSTPSRPLSGLSITASSNRKKKSKSRSYKFVQLQRALTSANLLKNNDDRIKFENEYLNSISKNTFDEFLKNYYQKIHNHYEHIKQEQELKKARIFTFFDLEKNFLALDPTRDVKIIFLDEPTSSTITKTTNTRPTTSAHPRSTSVATANDAAVEAFYAKRSHHLLNNPSRAHEEIISFARRTAERLQERLPRLSSVPHRVKILDERDTTGKIDERTLLQLKHKHTLSLINQRRHLMIKMMTQTKKNQIKMEQQWNPTPLAIDSSACCRELLERANQIEQDYREQQIRQRPQTAIVSQIISSKNLSSSASSDITTTNTNRMPSFSSSSIPFQDALSIHHVEKTRNVRVILPARPLTAPTRVNWINYC